MSRLLVLVGAHTCIRQHLKITEKFTASGIVTTLDIYDDLSLIHAGVLVGLISVIVDGLLCARNEYRYVWLQPWSKVKLLYIFSRYGAVVVHSVSYAVTSSLSSLVSGPHICYNWILFQHISFSTLYFVFELVLMLRVIPRMVQDEECIVIEAPTDTGIFGLMLLQNQAIIAGLTLWRYRHAIRDGWANIPVVKLVIRDGVWIFCAITAVFAATIPYSMFVEHMGHVFFSLLVTIASIFACRLILNMQSLISTDPLNGNHTHHTEEDLQLTSFTGSFISCDDREDATASLVESLNGRGTERAG
ncbi:hypothetical protein BDQ17DRAFT_1412785 [Cyathus striatus]|nr:hypothetical protein BDQ17DRAFT_1412785 [Cyathus striatus]